jgi:hypothetical protein
MVCFRLPTYAYYKVKMLCRTTQQPKNTAGAFCKVYTNKDIFKDFVKLLSAPGQSQQDVA